MSTQTNITIQTSKGTAALLPCHDGQDERSRGEYRLRRRRNMERNVRRNSSRIIPVSGTSAVASRINGKIDSTSDFLAVLLFLSILFEGRIAIHIDTEAPCSACIGLLLLAGGPSPLVILQTTLSPGKRRRTTTKGNAILLETFDR